MSFSARVLADSISANTGCRVTTTEAVISRNILSEVNTHRMLSRNSASSRAIPVKKQLIAEMTNPYVPERFGVNQPGMQSKFWLGGAKHEAARATWLRGRDRAVLTAVEMLYSPKLAYEAFAGQLSGMSPDVFKKVIDWLEEERVAEHNRADVLNVHKQFANRVLEPFLFHTILISATEWEHFLALRDHPDAQPEIQTMARKIKAAIKESEPQVLEMGEWHLPYIREDEKEKAAADPITWSMISAGRCARTSGETQNGIRDIDEDLKLADRLKSAYHMSPFEHPCTPSEKPEFIGNFRGFSQLRKQFPNEDNFARALELVAEQQRELEAAV